MALVWDGTVIRCDEAGCGQTERVPTWSSYEDAVIDVDEWLERKTWSTAAGRHLCPEHG
jgi:hypothetical protein